MHTGTALAARSIEPSISHGHGDRWYIGGIISELEPHIDRYNNSEYMKEVVEKVELYEMLFRRIQLVDEKSREGRHTLTKVRSTGACMCGDGAAIGERLPLCLCRGYSSTAACQTVPHPPTRSRGTWCWTKSSTSATACG